MAFDFFQSDEDKDKVAGQNQGSEGQSLGEESPIVTGNSATQTPGKGTSSGAFTNLQSYLDANKDLKFGEQVAGQVGSKLDEAESAQNQAKTNFQSDVDKNTVSEDKSLLDRLSSSPESLAGNQNDFEKFSKMRDARYGGPNNLEETSYYDPAYQKTQNALSTVNATKDEAGRKAYLQNQYGSGAGRYDYTSGMQKLDNLLIQNDPNSKKAFEDLRTRGNQVGQNFSSLSDYLNQYAQGAKNQTAATRADTRQALGIDDAGNYLNSGAIASNLGTLDSEVAKRQADLQKDKAYYSSLPNAAYLNSLSQDNLSKTGLNPTDFGGANVAQDDSYFKGWNSPSGYLFGLNPSDTKYWSSTPQGDINRGTVTSPEELAKVQALSKLANLDQTFISNPNQVGKYREGALASYDPNLFRQAVGVQKAGYQSDMQNVLDHLHRAESQGVVDASTIQNEINAVRRKYGLPNA